MNISGAIMAVLISVASAVLGAIALDIYMRVKSGSKKIINKHKQESKQELEEAISLTLTEALKPIQKDIELLKESMANITQKDIPQLKDANRDSLRNQLLAVYRHCSKLGFRTVEDSENWEYMFESYTGLGGNSFIVSLRDLFLKLPIKTISIGDHK